MSKLPGFIPIWNTLPLATASRIGSWVTTRGEPTGDLFDFNLALHVSDDSVNVLSRRRLLEQTLGCEVTWLNQVHSAVCVDAHVYRQEAITMPCDADASMTSNAGIACAVMTADCLPVLFASGNGISVGAAHAGWRGLLNGVLENCANQVMASACIEPKDLHVYMGPAIGPMSFEVGADVFEAFLSHDDALEKAFIPSKPVNLNQPKYLANLYTLAQMRLQAMGVCHFNGGGVDLEFDTFTQDQWFSYRRQATTGRMASLVWLRA